MTNHNQFPSVRAMVKLRVFLGEKIAMDVNGQAGTIV